MLTLIYIMRISEYVMSNCYDLCYLYLVLTACVQELLYNCTTERVCLSPSSVKEQSYDLYYLYLVLTAHRCTGTTVQLYNRTGVFESIQCERTKQDCWERERTPTSAAASLLLSITTLLPGFLINKLSSSSCCLSTCVYTGVLASPRWQREAWSLLRNQ